MTMGSPEIERKVRQLDNDVQSIYVMLADIQATQQRHSNRFQELTDMLGGHDARFDAVDARFNAVDARFDAVDSRFDAVDARFDAHDARFDAHDARFDALDEKLDTVLELLKGRETLGD